MPLLYAGSEEEGVGLNIGPHEYRKLLRRVIASNRGKLEGLECSEDIAHEILLRRLEGKSQHQTVDQSVIDYARKYVGDPRSSGYASRLAIRNHMLLDEAKMAAPEGENNGRIIARCAFELLGDERVIFLLRFEWGFTEREIGHLFAVSGSRISQRLKEIQLRVQKALSKDSKKRSGIQAERKREVEAVEPKKIKRGAQPSIYSCWQVEEEKSGKMEGYNEAGFDPWLT